MVRVAGVVVLALLGCTACGSGGSDGALAPTEKTLLESAYATFGVVECITGAC